MNYLGHLFLSNDDIEMMYANLFGDFVKGSDLSQYAVKVREGITLHREIDSYIDHHPLTVDLMYKLQKDLPKVSPIAIDIYFDHLLAVNWNKFHPVTYLVFLDRFYNYNPIHWRDFSEEFQSFILELRKEKWLNYYDSIEGMDKACRGVSRRISFENALVNGKDVFLKYEDEITKTFFEFIQEAKNHFKIN